MPYTPADLERLDRAITFAELEVEMDGQRVRYRSVAELKAARDHVSGVLRESAATAAGGSGGGTFRFTFTGSRD